MNSARGWIATVAVIAIAVFVLTGGFSGSDPPKPAAAGVHKPPRPRTATLPFLALKHARGAQGKVSIESVKTEGHPRFKLTINLTIPKQRYGVSLWSSQRKWAGLYAGYPGTNVQTMTISARRLIRYRWLNVGQQVLHLRRGRVIHRNFRQMLRASTQDLLAALLADQRNAATQ